MLNNGERRDVGIHRVLVGRLMVATIPPFVVGMLFSILTEPSVASRSSNGMFSGGLRDACAASSIFSTNGFAALIFMSGLVTGGVSSIVGLAAFGKEFSSVCIGAYLYGTPVSQIAAATAPHGVLEVPALFLAGAAGLAGVPLMWSLARGTYTELSSTLMTATVLSMTSMALLIPAALVECHATPIVLRWAL